MINAKEMVNAIRSLGMPPSQFAVCGSSVLLAHGLISLVRDVDIIAFDTAWNTVCGSNTLRRAPHGDEVVSFRDGLIEVYNGLSNFGWRIEDVIAQADQIDGIRYVQVERILEVKKRLSLPHDLEHIRLIEEYLAARKSRSLQIREGLGLKKSA